MRNRGGWWWLLVALAGFAQEVAVGPKLVRQVEPKYTSEAQAARIEGTVLVALVVDEQGNPVDLKIARSLGHGLDETALAAVSQWKFTPAKAKDGQPVRFPIRAELKFRLLGGEIDPKQAARRQAFTRVMELLGQPSEAGTAARELARLSAEGYPPAQYRYGLWMLEGSHGVERNTGTGVELMKAAALSGDKDAEVFLAFGYLRGEVLPRDAEQARVYMGACALHMVAACQQQLGQELYQMRGRVEQDHIEAVAMLELAQESGSPDAEAFLERVAPRLSVSQRKAVDERKVRIRAGGGR